MVMLRRRLRHSSYHAPSSQRCHTPVSLILLFICSYSFHCQLPLAFAPSRTTYTARHHDHSLRKTFAFKTTLFQSSVGYESNIDDQCEEKITEKITQEPPVRDEKNKEITKKILNGLLLAASFGYAAYTIFNIDAGMTRGWTQQEIAMRIPLDNWLNYESSLADRPIFTKTAINVIIYLLGDWLSQTIFKGQNILEFDAGRTLKNGLIGLCFGPLVHEYYQFSDYILPVEGGMWNRFEKILMDQTIYLIVKCSIYIAAVGFLAGENAETVKNNVQTKLPGIVVTAWKFWPLVHLGKFTVNKMLLVMSENTLQLQIKHMF